MNSQNDLQELLNSSNSILNDSFSIPLEGKINYNENNKKINYNENNKKINNNMNKNHYNIKDLSNNNINNIHIIKNNNDNNLNQRTLISISTSAASLINDSNNKENSNQKIKEKIKKLKNNLNKKIYPNKFIEMYSNNSKKNKINNNEILNNNNIKIDSVNKIIPLKYAKKQCRRHSGFNHHKCDLDDCERDKKTHKNKKNKKKVHFKNDFIEVINVESWKSFNNLSFVNSINIKKIKNKYDCSCLIM